MDSDTTPPSRPAPPSQEKLEQATRLAQEAKEAAERVEKSAGRPRYWLIAGFSFVLVGAVMAFSLKNSESAWLGVKLEPLGGVLLAIGAVLLVAAAVSSATGGDGVNPDGVKSIGGLVAVIVGITAVTALAIVTIAQISGNQNSIVAITSSAFGVISAVTGAYLGIKISADTTNKAGEGAQDAARSETKLKLLQQELSAVTKKADEVLPPAKANEIKAAAVNTEDDPPPETPPAQGG